MKRKIVRALLTQMCVATMAISLTGCGYIRAVARGVRAVAESVDGKEDKESDQYATNFEEDIAKAGTIDEDFDATIEASSYDYNNDATEDTSSFDDNTDLTADTSSYDYNNDTSTYDDYSDTQEADLQDSTTGNASSGSATTASYLTADAQAALDRLDTDYNKVKWGVQYSPTGMDYLVISVTPYFAEDNYHLIIAVTNLYNTPLIFDGTGYAKGFSGENVSDISIYEPLIAPGNTAIMDVPCSDIPSGEIHWDSINIPDSGQSDAYWESDWSIGKADGDLKLDYTMYSSDYFMPGYVKVLVLDSDGYVIDYADDYNIEEGYSVSGTIAFYKSDFNGTCSDVALFANPTIVE